MALQFTYYMLFLVSESCFLKQCNPSLQSCLVFQTILRADSRFARSQWETALLCNDVSHWLGASLESALYSSLSCLTRLLPNFSPVLCIDWYLALAPMLCLHNLIWRHSKDNLGLTLGALEKMANILQTTFLIAFSLIKTYVFQINFRLNMFLTINQHCFR